MQINKKVFISGITGQDGVFLTKHLLSKGGYEILGTSRNIDNKDFYQKLEYLCLPSDTLRNLKVVKANLLNSIETHNLLNSFSADYIYNFSGPSSVYKSFHNPKKTKFEILKIFNNLTQAIKSSKIKTTLFQASSSEIFGKMEEGGLHEESKVSPISPYGEAKAEIHKNLNYIREDLGINIINGIMFNHESEFRNNEYLFMKIINSAKQIKFKNSKNLVLGSLKIERDWSYSNDLINGINLITENFTNENFVLGSGLSTSIKDIVNFVFDWFELDYKEFIKIDKSLLRPSEPLIKYSKPKKISDLVNWRTTTLIEEVLEKNIKYLLMK